MNIAYCLNTANESRSYIQPLLERLIKGKQPQDEIIVVDDFSTNEETLKVIEEYSDKISLHKRKLEGSFAEHKNYFNQLVSSETKFIVNLDADELVSEVFMNTIHEILENNPSIDLYYLARINIVQGLTPEYVAQCGWTVNEQGYIQFPDVQGRVYRVSPEIYWKGSVHEVISGTNYHTTLPYLDSDGKIDPSFCLLHVKSLSRQQAQNEKYSKM
jgi:glycosyltransferase involved in cell wall biosynthesis